MRVDVCYRASSSSMTTCTDPLDLICYWTNGDYGLITIIVVAEMSLALLLQATWKKYCSTN